jgi:predicted Zn-dependent protease
MTAPPARPPFPLPDDGELHEIVGLALSTSTASETEVLFSHRVEATTRFASDGITQNVFESHGQLVVRALLGKRTGRASTTSFAESDIKDTAARAVAAAEVATEDAEALSLPGPQSYEPIDHFDPQALAESPHERASRAARAVSRVRASGLRPAGSASSGGTVEVVANSRGLFACHRASHARFAVTALCDAGSGWAERLARSSAGIDTERVIDVAIEKAERGRTPRVLDPGDFTVVLEPAAVTDLLLFFGWCAVSGLAYNEGRSFLSGKLGERLFSPALTITDDFLDPLSPGPPFDAEGMPRQRVALVERGVARAVVHDRRTARAAGGAVTSTGHALPQPSTSGPLPQNLVIAPGETSLEELIRSTERGVLVTRLHYTNVVEPKQLLLTGMTRDGTFLIEKGQLTSALKNLRFTDSAARVFAGIEAAGNDPLSLDALFGGNFVSPSLKVRSFAFSSGTEF